MGYVIVFFFYRMIPPAVTWAQRRNVIFVTFCVEDCKNPTLDIMADKVYFKGQGGTEKKIYEVTIELYGEVNAEVYFFSFYIHFVYF